MRKLIVAAVGLLTVLTALPLYAAEINFSGEFRVRGFWTDNLADGNAGGGVNEDAARFNDARFRLKTAIKAGVTTGVVVLDFGNCIPGADASTFNAFNTLAFGTFTGDCRFGTGGLGQSFNVVGVREAHIQIDLKSVKAILGRQTLKLGHGIVFDDTGDAITLVFGQNGTIFTGSMVQIADNTDASVLPTTSVHKDTTLWVLNVGMDHKDHVVNLYNALLYDQNTSGSTAVTFIYPTSLVAPGFGTAPMGILGLGGLWLNILGVSVDADSGPMKLALEGSYSIGRGLALPGFADARLHGWNLMADATMDAGGAKIGGTFVAAAGHDPSGVNEASVSDISGNFQLGNILLNNEQMSDREGGSLGGGFTGPGITAVKAHVSTMPSDKLTVGGALIYALSERVCQACGRVVGLEVDANAAYEVDDNLTLSAGAGYLIPGDGTEDFYSIINASGSSDNPLWKMVARAVFTF